MNAIKRVTYVTVILLAMVVVQGCSGNRTSLQEPDKVTVYIDAKQDASTRTYIGGENLDETLWSEFDKLNIYWRESGSAGVPTGTQFSYYDSYKGQTTFSATLPPMPSGNYTYYGFYPAPDQIDGTHIIYTLPDRQDGTYDMQHTDIRDGVERFDTYSGNCDIMIARPVEAAALTDLNDNLQMEFLHQCHALRIEVPDERNLLGDDIARLRIRFPNEVVGTLELDMTNPEGSVTFSNGQSIVWLDLHKALVKGEKRYLWLFVAPVRIAGAITFTAYDSNGYQSCDISVSLDKELQPGRITPITLTIPQELPVKWIDFSIVASHLGEDINQLTITAPEGAVFRNGSSSVTFDKNSEDRYALGFYPTIDGIDNESLLLGGDFTVTYDSDNALITETHSITDLSAEHTLYSLTVPYLFYEDFSGAQSATLNGTSSKETELYSYNLAGWSGHNINISAGTSIRMEAHLASAWLTNPDGGLNRRGRIDSPQMSNLKDGAIVTLEASFDVGGTTAKSVGESVYAEYMFGSDTQTGAISYKTAIANPIFTADQRPASNGSYTNLPTHVTTEMPSMTNAHRLSWRSSFTVDGWLIADKEVYIYLDNIKVSIKK